jgi:hypothetical protein
MKFNELNELLFEGEHDKEERKRTLSQEDKDAIAKFFMENKNPTDSEFHGWAESESIDVHKAEEAAYEMAHKFAIFSQTGRWNEKGQPKVDPDELEMGIQVEYEHTKDTETAKRIALDHLAEIDDYYTRLDKMEKEAGVDHHDEEGNKDEE